MSTGVGQYSRHAPDYGFLAAPQGVSNVAWALATAGHRDDVLFAQLLSHCLSDISSYDAQGLSNILWACATLGYKDTVFLSAALQECSHRIERMSSQNLSNVLWACATLGHADGRMLGTWAEEVIHKLDMFEPQGLSNTGKHGLILFHVFQPWIPCCFRCQVASILCSAGCILVPLTPTSGMQVVIAWAFSGSACVLQFSSDFTDFK